MPSANVTVPSVFAREYGFTVTGTNTLAYAQRFANALDVALSAGTLGYTNLSGVPGDSIPGYNSASDPTVREQEISSAGSYTLSGSASGIYTFVSSGSPVTVTGSGAGDNLLVEGEKQVQMQTLTAPSSTTYIDVGGDNLITFVDGNNVYDGTLASGTDTIVAGSGDDTIGTGGGSAIVFSGTGSGTFTLNDTVVAGADSMPKSVTPSDYNQFVFLDDGTNTIHANGLADVVIATAPGQLIIGGASTADTDLVSFIPPSTLPAVTNVQAAAAPDAAVGDTVVANAATFSVYNATDNNAIFSGSGALVAVFADSVAGSVVGGTGTTDVYGNAGDTIDYFSTDTMTGGIVVLGTGAESVDGSFAKSILTVVLGTGNETLTSGTNTTYNANVNDTGNGTSITINDFVPTDTFNFVGYTEDQYNAALASGTTVSGGYQITLSDSTTVTFTNISSIAGHTTMSPSSSS